MKCRQGLPDTVPGLSGAKPAGEKGPELDVPYEVHSREGVRQLRTGWSGHGAVLAEGWWEASWSMCSKLEFDSYSFSKYLSP